MFLVHRLTEVANEYDIVLTSPRCKWRKHDRFWIFSLECLGREAEFTIQLDQPFRPYSGQALQLLLTDVKYGDTDIEKRLVHVIGRHTLDYLQEVIDRYNDDYEPEDVLYGDEDYGNRILCE